MIYLTRRVEFSAAHTLYNPDMSPEENEQCFGKCGNPKGHGHNYVLEITVKGEIDKKTGFFINVDTLKQIIRAEVVDVLDHRFINVEIDYFKKNVPTCENMAMWVWSRLESKLENCSLHRVRLYETRNNYVEYYGDAGEEIR
ncbi:MAG: 6-carboxytetrahydropterin synthase [Gemmatimonadota bacterium]|nr:MAG: 6-carboxytetrahydropterin synthase [Gemmatimonadota bacterium]